MQHCGQQLNSLLIGILNLKKYFKSRLESPGSDKAPAFVTEAALDNKVTLSQSAKVKAVTESTQQRTELGNLACCVFISKAYIDLGTISPLSGICEAVSIKRN